MANNTIHLKFGMYFGIMADPIRKQLKDAGVLKASKAVTDRWQKIADSITMLAIHQMIPESVRDKARLKLLRDICKQVFRTSLTPERTQGT